MLKRGLIFVFCIFLFSCSGEDKEIRPIEHFALQKSSFAALDGWTEDNLASFQKALVSVCNVIGQTSQKSLKSEVLKIPVAPYREKCQEMVDISDTVQLKKYIENNFEPYLVVVDGHSKGKFTSYYEAAIRASFKRGGKYQYPIYGKPKDLVEVQLKDFDKSLPNRRIVGRVKNGKLVKYYTREEIDAGKIDGANVFQRFFNITLPSIMPVVAISTLLSTIWTFNDFDNIWLITGGGPLNASSVIATYTYEQAFMYNDMARGMAVAVSVVPVLLILMVLVMKHRSTNE